MPISLSSLKSGQKTFTFEYDGESSEITYSTSAYTPALETVIQEKLAAGMPATSTARILSEMLIEWDVIDENGEALDTDFANLAMFPVNFLTTLLSAISEDQRVTREDRKNSPTGSRARANKASARNGIR